MPSLPAIDGWTWNFDKATGKWALQQTHGSLSEIIRRLTPAAAPAPGNHAVQRRSVSGAASILTSRSPSPPASPRSTNSALLTDSRPASINQQSTSPANAPQPAAQIASTRAIQDTTPPPYVNNIPQTSQPFATLAQRQPQAMPIGFMHGGLPTGPPFPLPVYPPIGLVQPPPPPPVVQIHGPAELQTHPSVRVARRPVSTMIQQPPTSQDLQNVQQGDRNLSRASFSSSISQLSGDQTSMPDAGMQIPIAELPASPVQLPHPAPAATPNPSSTPDIVAPAPLRSSQLPATAALISTPGSFPATAEPTPTASPSTHETTASLSTPPVASSGNVPASEVPVVAQSIPSQDAVPMSNTPTSLPTASTTSAPASSQSHPVYTAQHPDATSPSSVYSQSSHVAQTPIYDPEQHMLSMGSPLGPIMEQPSPAIPQQAIPAVQPAPVHASLQPQLQTTFNFDPNTGKPLSAPHSAASSVQTTTQVSQDAGSSTGHPPLQHVYTSPDIIAASTASQASSPQSNTQSPSQPPPLVHTVSAPQVMQTTSPTGSVSSAKDKVASMRKTMGNWAGKTGKWISENPNTAMAGVAIAQVGGAAFGLDLRQQGRAANIGINQLKIKRKQQADAQAQASSQSTSPQTTSNATSPAAGSQPALSPQSPHNAPGAQHASTPASAAADSAQRMAEIYQMMQNMQAGSGQQGQPVSATPLQNQQQAAVQLQQQQLLQQYLAAQQQQQQQQQQAALQYNAALQQLSQQYAAAQQQQQLQAAQLYMPQQPTFQQNQTAIDSAASNPMYDSNALNLLMQYSAMANANSQMAMSNQLAQSNSAALQDQSMNSLANSLLASQLTNTNADSASSTDAFLSAMNVLTADSSTTAVDQTTAAFDITAAGSFDTVAGADVDVTQLI